MVVFATSRDIRLAAGKRCQKMKNSHWVNSLGQQVTLPYLDKEINLVCNLEVSALMLPKG